MSDREIDFEARYQLLIEIMQAERHAMLSRLHTISTAIAFLEFSSSKPNSKEHWNEVLHSMSTSADQLYESIDRLKLVTAPSNDQFSTINVRKIWDQAIRILEGHLDRLEIHIQFESRFEPELYGRPDQLKHVFINLIMNSLDAFRRMHKREPKHRIVIRVPEPHSSSKELTLFYIDNAGGLSASILNKIKSDPRRLFERGFTTKRDDSGYGLAVVQMIMANHKGSIDLISSNGKIEFKLTFPRR